MPLGYNYHFNITGTNTMSFQNEGKRIDLINLSRKITLLDYEKCRIKKLPQLNGLLMPKAYLVLHRWLQAPLNFQVQIVLPTFPRAPFH